MGTTERGALSRSAEHREPPRSLAAEQQNVGTAERWLSAIAGGALTTYGLLQRTAVGGGLATAGSYLVYRGVAGNCLGYRALGVNTATEPGAVQVKKAITIDKSPAELYQFWRNFENLPSFMDHLESVTVHGSNRSHWVAKAPAGMTVEWDANITDERPNERITWHSTPDSDVENWGTVRFVAEPASRGTVVHVEIEYRPPAGRLGAGVARLFGEEPNQQVQEDLRRFKRLMESGVVPTTAGQPHGTRSVLGKILSAHS